MKRAPKVYRRKKMGKFVGNFFVDVRGRPVNLATQDAHLALVRRTEALKGIRVFQDDADAAADATVAAVAAKPSPLEPPLTPPAAPPESPPAAPSAATSPADALPIADPTPEPAAAAAEPETAEDAIGAAADDADDEPPADGVPTPAAANAEFVVTIEDVLRILKIPARELAPAAVDLQLKGHELIYGLGGYDVAPIAADNPFRGVLAAGYEPVIKLLQAEDLKIHPGWFILVGTLGLAAAQFQTATKKTDAKGPGLAAVP